MTHIDGSAGEDSHSYPSLLPDGRHVLYAAYQPLGRGALGIYLTTLGSSKRRLLIKDGANAAFSQGFVLFNRKHGECCWHSASDETTFETIGAPRLIAERIITGGTSRQTGAFAVSPGGILVYATSSQNQNVAARVVRSKRQETGYRW